MLKTDLYSAIKSEDSEALDKDARRRLHSSLSSLVVRRTRLSTIITGRRRLCLERSATARNIRTVSI